MKSFVAAVVLFVSLTAAQTTQYNYPYGAEAPKCGTDCFNNMLFDAPNYGCKATTGDGPNAGADLSCLCGNGNWNQNFNNCVNQHCGTLPPYSGIDPNHTANALTLIADACKQGISTTASVFTTSGVDSASSSFTTTVTAVGAGPVIFTVTSGGSTYTSTISGVGTASTESPSAGGNATAVVVTTTDSAGNTTLSTVTGSAINGTATGAAGNGTLVGGGVITTTDSAGSTITSTESSSSGSATSTETSVSTSTGTSTATSSGGSGGSGSSSAAPASSSKAAGGHFAAPGFAGVAGLAAFAFL